MEVVAHLPAGSQAAESVQVGERALHDPALHAEPGAVLGAPAGDQRPHAEIPHQAAVLVMVVATVRQHRVRRRRGRPCSPRTGGTAWRSGISWVTSLRLPPVSVQANGIPVASVTRWCLLPVLPRSTGLRPVLVPPLRL